MDTVGLMRRAASCFLRANRHDAACRCFEAAGEHHRAARLHEQGHRWGQAAEAFERAAAWQDAARCHRQADQPEAAVRCLELGAELLQAAWLLSTQLRHHGRACRLASEAELSSSADRLRQELVLAHAELHLRRDANGAAVRLERVISELGTAALASDGRELVDWFMLVAHALERPDLAALAHAQAVRYGASDAARRWERWATETLGDATGVPVARTDPMHGRPDGRKERSGQ